MGRRVVVGDEAGEEPVVGGSDRTFGVVPHAVLDVAHRDHPDDGVGLERRQGVGDPLVLQPAAGVAEAVVDVGRDDAVADEPAARCGLHGDAGDVGVIGGPGEHPVTRRHGGRVADDHDPHRAREPGGQRRHGRHRRQRRRGRRGDGRRGQRRRGHGRRRRGDRGRGRRWGRRADGAAGPSWRARRRAARRRRRPVPASPTLASASRRIQYGVESGRHDGDRRAATAQAAGQRGRQARPPAQAAGPDRALEQPGTRRRPGRA